MPSRHALNISHKSTGNYIQYHNNSKTKQSKSARTMYDKYGIRVHNFAVLITVHCTLDIPRFFSRQYSQETHDSSSERLKYGVSCVKTKFDPCFTIVIVMKCPWWRHQMETFPRYWPFERGIHWSQVNSPHKGQWRGTLMLYLIYAWINGSVNNREAGDLRRHRAHYDVTAMISGHIRSDLSPRHWQTVHLSWEHLRAGLWEGQALFLKLK